MLDNRYTVIGDPNCWIKSLESDTVSIGDVRIIGDRLMKIVKIDNPPWYSLHADTAHWIPVENVLYFSEEFNDWIKKL